MQCHSASFATVSGPETKVTLLYEPLMFWSRRDASGLRVPIREYRQRPLEVTEFAGAFVQLSQYLQNVLKPLILQGMDGWFSAPAAPARRGGCRVRRTRRCESWTISAELPATLQDQTMKPAATGKGGKSAKLLAAAGGARRTSRNRTAHAPLQGKVPPSTTHHAPQRNARVARLLQFVIFVHQGPSKSKTTVLRLRSHTLYIKARLRLTPQGAGRRPPPCRCA